MILASRQVLLVQRTRSVSYTHLALGSKRADFFFKMRDTLTCVMGEKLEPRYFRKGAEEGKRYTVDEAWFSYKDGLCFAKQKRTFRDGEVQESEESDSRCIYDMLTILAQARSYDPADYKVGDKIKFPMATGRKVEEQTLIYRGKENVKAENGVTYRCLIFSLVEYDKNCLLYTSGCISLIELGMYTLDNHNRIIDHNRNGKHKGTQGQQVQTESDQ